MGSLFVRTMHVQIVLESPKTTFTNLDVIRGRAILRLFGPTQLTSIVVKLEGESRTRLKAMPGSVPGRVDDRYDEWSREKPIQREETHKLLYMVANVFPDTQFGGAAPSARSVTITLAPGNYEYPFEFKFPFNNSCNQAAPSVLTGITLIKNVGLKGAAAPITHVKGTLPPTLTTFPGLAEIKYFVKVTVNRKEFYKENPRVIQNLNFFPIEPPRDPPTGAESYARRQHEFVAMSGAAGKQRKGLFDGFKGSVGSASSSTVDTGPPVISVDLRLNSPPILTCNQDLPMRIILRRLNASTEPLFLQSLHIQLHGITRIRANEIWREESSNWVLVSQSNMGFALRKGQGKGAQDGSEGMIIDAGHWKRHPLPSTVAPTFQTCNILRKYELEVHIGIGFGTANANNTIVLPLRQAVEVYSGIEPSAPLLAAMAGRRVPGRRPAQPVPAPRPAKSSSINAPSYMQGASASASTSASASAIPPTAQDGPSTPIETPQTQFGPLPAGEEEPPPTYEDAIASDLPPIDGPSRESNYQPPAIARGGFDDEKQRRGS